MVAAGNRPSRFKERHKGTALKRNWRGVDRRARSFGRVLLLSVEVEDDAVDAVALTRRRRTVWENVAEMWIRRRRIELPSGA